MSFHYDSLFANLPPTLPVASTSNSASSLPYYPQPSSSAAHPTSEDHGEFPLDPSLFGPIVGGDAGFGGGVVGGGGGRGSGRKGKGKERIPGWGSDSDDDDGEEEGQDEPTHGDGDDVDEDGEEEEEGYDSEEDDMYEREEGINAPTGGVVAGKKRRKATQPPVEYAEVGRGGAKGKNKGKGKARDQDFSVAGGRGGGRDDEDDDEEEEYQDPEELGRLISAIRDSTTSAVGGRTALDKEFDRSIEEELDALGDPKTKKGKRKSMGRRAVADMEPSLEVKAMLGQANEDYARGSFDSARETLTEIIRIDPSIRSSWYLLSTIFEAEENDEGAVLCAIVAAHLLGPKEAKAEWAELGRRSRDCGLLQQAVYCFGMAIKGDKGDVDSMWDRAVLLKMSGSDKQAITAFTALLTIIPHDPGVLRELAPLLAAQNQHSTASQLYLAAFEFYRLAVPHVTDPFQISSFGIEDLEVLSDLLLHQKAYDTVVSLIKIGVRWLSGREGETGWDGVDDDREYDEARKRRSGWERDARYLEETGINELDVRLRVRLGIARLKMDRVEEAKRHFAIVLNEDVAEYAALFGAIGDAYLERKMYLDALDIFQDMAENEETNGVTVWTRVGECNQALGDYDGALECFEAVVATEPNNYAAKMQLAKVYELMEEPARALGIINEVIEARRQAREAGDDPDAHSNTGPGGKPRRGRTDAANRQSKEQRSAHVADQIATEELRQQEFTLAYRKLSSLEPDVERGDDGATKEWLEVATYLVDAFRETKQLFPSDSKKKFTGILARSWKRRGAAENDIEAMADQMATRLERSMGSGYEPTVEVEATAFRGITFEEWISLIIKYAFQLTKNDEYEAGKETLDHISHAVVFKHSKARSETLQIAMISCAIKARDAASALRSLRWIWLRRPYETEPLRLLQAVLCQGLESTEALNDASFQKFVVRFMKLVDTFAREGEGSVAHTAAKQHANEDEDDNEDEETAQDHATTRGQFRPTKVNPVLFAAYGMMLLVSKSWQSSIIYLLRAYEQIPEEPLLNLCLAIAYLHRSMSRQTDNRQHQIAQSVAFLSQYRKLRGGSSQEVEYNFGRAFHHLGLQSLAVKHYENVLRLAEADQANLQGMAIDDESPTNLPDDFSKVAAYNLSNLYLVTGNPVMARTTAARWLSV